MSKQLKLGLQLGYWGALCPPNHVELAQEAEKLGYDSVWTAESWGSDVFTPLSWIGAHTSKIRLGTSVAQLSARTPAACAMAALTLDHLSNGRMILGLGVSGPQVVEGWYGQPYTKPLTRTREYVSIIRKILAREGMMVVIYLVDSNNKKLSGEPSVISRGFVYVKENKRLLGKIKKFAVKLYQDNFSEQMDLRNVRQIIQGKLEEMIYRETGRQPMVLPLIIEV